MFSAHKKETDATKRYKVMRSVLRDLLSEADFNEHGNPEFVKEAVYKLYVKRMRVVLEDPDYKQSRESVHDLRRCFTRKKEQNVEIIGHRNDVAQFIARNGKPKKGSSKRSRESVDALSTARLLFFLYLQFKVGCVGCVVLLRSRLLLEVTRGTTTILMELQVCVTALLSRNGRWTQICKGFWKSTE